MKKQPYNPATDRFWWAALKHLEKEQPSELRYLMEQGGKALEVRLSDLVNQGNKVRYQMQQKGAGPDEATEVAMSQVIAPPSELGQDAKPLNSHERASLEAFRQKHQAE